MNPEPVRWWIASLVTAIVLLVLPLPDWLVDRFYSRGIFPYLQSFLTSLSNLVPLALLDVFLLGAAALVGWRIFALVRAARRRGVLVVAWEGIRRLVRAVSIVTILFVCFWGLNYRRIPLEAALRVPHDARPSVEQLQGVIADAGALAGRLRPASSWTIDEASYENVDSQLRVPFNEALSQLGRPPLSTPGRPKYSLVLTPFFAWAGVNGMVDPLALESIVSPDLLPFERPFVLAHEWAHLAGQADEAEASAVGWLACMLGGPELAYSASLYLVVEAGGVLPSRAWQAARSALDVGVRADLDALARRLARERPTVRRVAFRAYDQYLRANRVDDGVTSYSRALSLILASPLRDALASYHISRDGRPR